MTTGSYTAWLFHETYERLAPEYGYEVRPDVGGRAFHDLPDNNRRLMIATATEVVETLKVDALRDVLGDLVDALSDELSYEISRTPEVQKQVRRALDVLELETMDGYRDAWWLG